MEKFCLTYRIYRMPRRRQVKGRKKFRRNKKGNKKGNKYTRLQSLRVRQPGVVVPDRMYMKLQYTDTTTSLLGAAGSTYGYVRYYSNSVFDANPLVLTSTVIGHGEMSALYQRYRVHGCSITVTGANMMDFPVNVMIWPTTDDQNALMSPAYLQAMLSNAFCQWRSVSAKGGMDRFRLKGYISTKKLVGSGFVNVDDTFQALTSTNPVKLLFWNLASYSISIGTFYTVESIPFEARITYYVEYYDRRQLTQ